MKIVLASNYLNHYQLALCNEFINKVGFENFKFIATEKIPIERIKLGFEDLNSKFPFVIREYDNHQEAIDALMNADVAIIGSAPEYFIRNRVKTNGKITFRYSERLYKTYKKIHYTGPLKLFIRSHLIEKNKVFLLCNSAFSYSDYMSGLAYHNRSYKWGYFSEFNEINIKRVIKNKKKNSFVWVARYLDWKHPEIPVEIAKRLKDDGFDFSIDMVGNGDMLEEIKTMIKENNLCNYINIVGSVPSNKVKEYMEKSQIFLFTSDRGEGWGVVLNEAMNCGCVPIANSEIGSVPYLIKDGRNGFIYEDGNIDDLYNKVKRCLIENSLLPNLAINAYSTIKDTWNPKTAVNNFIKLVNYLMLNKSKKKYKLKTGPCSNAEILKDNWYKGVK